MRGGLGGPEAPEPRSYWKITIISNGGDGIGASKVTQDIVDIIAQLPPVLEGVSGVNLKELISKIPGVTQKK